MKIRLEHLAQQLIEEGFSSKQIDSDKLTDRIIEILSDKDFFNNLHDEMTLIEEENHPEPTTKEEYLERIGEF
jgi:hypothetical protein